MYTRVAADVVAMDSPLPLKSRDSLSRASGDLPKLGMELFLNEKQMSDIDAMIAQGMDINTIVQKIFEDGPRVIAGVYERLEGMFLQGLSTGIALADNNNVGSGVRVNYGYLDANKFGVKVKWNGNVDTATPIDDINKVLNKASEDGNVIIKAYADKYWIDAFAASNQAREEVDRTIKYEKNGVKTNEKPWKKGTIVFVCDNRIGSLVWTRLAEMNHPVAGVSYQTADQYILVSKYRVNRPSLREYTTSQARVVPVIYNVERIYTQDIETVQA